jgi:hypothetical protein
MPRYFFIVQTLDGKTNDQKGTLLKNDAEAVALAEGIIKKIKREKIKTKDDLGKYWDRQLSSCGRGMAPF